MAAFPHRVRLKSFSLSSPQILFSPIRNKLISLNVTNYCHLRPQARTVFSSLQAKQFLFQKHVFPSRRSFMKCLQTFPTTREKSFSISNFLATKNSRHFSSLFLPQTLNHSSLLSPNPICPFEIQCRFKQKKNRNKKLQDDELSDDEASDSEDAVFEEETDLPLNYKQLTIRVKSPRADALLSLGLNISRAKTDSMFYGNKLLHNEKPLTKKSKNLDEGDCVDLIMEGSETVKVKRIKVLKISSERGQTDKVCVVLRAWRSPFSLESLPEEES